jgi:hypothetical protein
LDGLSRAFPAFLIQKMRSREKTELPKEFFKDFSFNPLGTAGRWIKNNHGYGGMAARSTGWAEGSAAVSLLISPWPAASESHPLSAST